jgi:hypothetical protein
MRRNVAGYVAGIGILAFGAAAWVMQLTPPAENSGLGAAVCFALLGILAQALGHKLGGNAGGNISFIPFLTAAMLAPNLATVLTVATAVLFVEISAKRAPYKVFFNVAQYTLGISTGIIAFRLAGGLSFLAHPALASNPFDEPRAAIGPAVALVFAFLGVNSSAVSGAIAISESRSFWHVWKKNSLTVVAYDVLSLPVVFLFVYVYVNWGATGAILMTAPLLGVRQLYKTNWQLERTNQELLQLMVAAIEARDPYTSGHSQRVSRNSKLIGQALGMSASEVDEVGRAALLHDVGKIHEMYAPILRKEGRLTAEEHALMQTHSAKSADLISNVSYLSNLVDVVRHHHENWDGTGYPSKLREYDIPLGSRIIMVADTIDAMTTDRPYRKALTKDVVTAELEKMKGRQFDPRIVDVLLASPLYHTMFLDPPVDRPRPTPRWSLDALGVRRTAVGT